MEKAWVISIVLALSLAILVHSTLAIEESKDVAVADGPSLLARIMESPRRKRRASKSRSRSKYRGRGHGYGYGHGHGYGYGYGKGYGHGHGHGYGYGNGHGHGYAIHNGYKGYGGYGGYGYRPVKYIPARRRSSS